MCPCHKHRNPGPKIVLTSEWMSISEIPEWHHGILGTIIGLWKKSWIHFWHELIWLLFPLMEIWPCGGRENRMSCSFTEAMLWAILSKENVRPLSRRPRTDHVPRVRTGGDYSLLGREHNPPKKVSEPDLGSSLKLNTFPSISVVPEVHTVPPR